MQCDRARPHVHHTDAFDDEKMITKIKNSGL
jgi:hypothetical protein